MRRGLCYKFIWPFAITVTVRSCEANETRHQPSPWFHAELRPATLNQGVDTPGAKLDKSSIRFNPQQLCIFLNGPSQRYMSFL